MIDGAALTHLLIQFLRDPLYFAGLGLFYALQLSQYPVKLLHGRLGFNLWVPCIVSEDIEARRRAVDLEAYESLKFLVAGFYLAEKCLIVWPGSLLPILVVVRARDLFKLGHTRGAE
jgi:hypothetical protein